MPNNNNHNNNNYDVFLSYARSDDESQQWVPKLAKAMETIFRSLSGRSLRIFVDTRQIETAQIWEDRLQLALEHSSVMVAVLSPSYFTAQWCGLEWDHFVALESKYKKKLNLPHDQGLIFPIKLVDWSKIFRPSEDELRRTSEANRRQFISFEGLTPGELQFERATKVLVEQIIAVLSRLDLTNEVDSDAHPPVTSRPANTSDILTQPRIRIGTNREHFIYLLSKAMHVTIIGFTNWNLVNYLNEALARKRADEGPNSFWLSIRVVFLGEAVLNLAMDELTSEFPDPSEANLKRIQIAGLAKRAVSYFFIRANHPHRWNLYEYNHLPPFVGAIFEMPDGQKVVNIATHRPYYSTSEHLFFEFSGMAGEIAYYQATFEDVIRTSTKQEEIILIGSPHTQEGGGFIVKHARFRRSVLTPKPHNNDWIAAVVIMLWQEEGGKAWPLLQIRTSENASRELDMLSNISGYINQQDCYEFDNGTKPEFLLQQSAYENAVRRELREELGVIKNFQWPRPQLIKEIRFYYPDRENFYFYLCRLKADISLHHIQAPAQMRRWSFDAILQAREYQVLVKASALLELILADKDVSDFAIRALADNLILHRHPDLAERFISYKNTLDELQVLKPMLRELMLRCQSYYDFYGERREILGLAGLQYREFFTSLVPTYAEIGVDGAPQFLEWLNSDLVAAVALKRLQAHYGNPLAIKNAMLDV